MSSRRPSKPGTGGGKGSGGQKKAQTKGAGRAADSSRRNASEPKGQTSPKKANASGRRAGGRQARVARAAKAPAGKAASSGGRVKGRAREISAGGVVVRGNEVVVIVPTRRAADGTRVLSLPKGHVDPGETPVQAAQREVREEAGIVAEPVRELGESRYWYRRDGRTIGKSVYFYLFKYLGGDTADHDEEVEEARWLPLKEAAKQLAYPAEREMVMGAIEHLKEGERKDR
jgi:8-oxo-dGTP pyrophosphatase MutT (NUDIX family)